MHFPDINPVALSIGPFSIYWYGCLNLIGLVLAFLYCLKYKPLNLNREDITDLFTYLTLGVIFGGSLGYILLYDFPALLDNPALILRFWVGRSFHGGLLGVLLAFFIYHRKTGRPMLSIADFITPAVPLGLAAGRLGNFINGELWGRITTRPWGIVFPHAGALPRHPSQLYAFFLEGILLFVILHFSRHRLKKPGQISGLFLVLYGVFRCYIELFREPDAHLGFIAYGWLTMGQVLSIPMILCGIFLLRGKKTCTPTIP
jgi:phosphatidylglycerol:prolipoprotein diacylglycerol transferase